MATNKNFEIKNGLTIAGTERISSDGAFTGSLASATTATTQSAADSSTKIATTAYTDAAITAVIGGAPGTLDTLNELAAAINDDASYASTLTTALATKAPLANPTFTGTITGTLATAAQTNITSVGSLTALDVAGTATMDGLAVDGSGTLSGNLQIQAASSGAKLTVGNFGDTARAATFQGGSILIDGGAATEIIIGDGNVAYMSIQTTDDATAMKIRNFSGSADLVTIERASGNVGIGTGSPLGDLSIGSNGNASGGNIQLGVDTNNANKYTAITSKAYASDAQPEGFITLASQAYDGGNDTFIGGGFGELDASTAVRFYTAASTNTATGTERMRIDSSGNVGINQTNPSAFNTLGGTQVVIGDGASGSESLTLYSNTYGHIAFADSNTSGSTAQYAGLIQYYHADNTMRFYTDSVRRMDILGGGDFVVATTTAIGSMYNGVSGIGFGYSPGGYGACVRGGTNTPFYVSTTSQGAGGFIEFAQNGATRGNITYTGSATSYNASSDYRLKENAVPIQNALSKIDSLNPVNFSWIESGDNSDGFLAHEIQEILPYTVTGTKDELYTVENTPEEKADQIGQPKYQVMDYGKLTPLLVKAIQEQQALIESLTTRLETLENA